MSVISSTKNQIEARTHSNPIEVKSHVLEDVRADRLNKGLQDLRSSSFYHAMDFLGGNYSKIANIFKYLLLINH